MLKESQIKSWFSQECRRRKLMIGKTVVERGVSEMCASNDVPSLGAADDALRVQAEEAPGEEEAPAVSSCEAGTELGGGPRGWRRTRMRGSSVTQTQTLIC